MREKMSLKEKVTEEVGGVLLIVLFACLVDIAAGAMELLWRFTKWVGEPLDKTFIAAASICCVLVYSDVTRGRSERSLPLS